MIFHSLEYVIFLLLVLLVYWRLPFRAQNVFLLAAGYVFYGFVHPTWVLLIFFTCLLDFSASRWIERFPERKKWFLALSLIVNFSILCYFKYANFFIENITAVLGQFGLNLSGWQREILIPAGVSFYTFHSASYTIDVYRGHIQARKSLVDYLLFVSFFPQLVAGPIHRASFLLSQVETPRIFDSQMARGAVTLLAWGYFKKLCIADNVGVITGTIFSLENPSFPVIWMGVLAFAVQIYADFSAYSDIARGCGRLFGFEMVINFNHPYTADSMADFWRRWHISLSTWFRDYVYIPLGGNRGTALRNAFTVIATFFLSGLWHGASWNYVIWGLYHGCLLVLWRHCGMDRIWRPLRVGLVFVLVCIGWLFFREENLPMAWRYLTTNPLLADVKQWQVGAYFLATIALYAFPLWLHPYVERWLKRKQTGGEGLGQYPGWNWALAQAVLVTVLFVAILLIRSTVTGELIYFQF